MCIDVAATTVTAVSTALVVRGQELSVRQPIARPHVKLKAVVPDRIRPIAVLAALQFSARKLKLVERGIWLFALTQI